MNLSNSIFEKYFSNQVSKEKLLYEIGSDTPQFAKTLEEELNIALLNKDGKRIEYLIYTLFLIESNIDIHQYVNVLNELLLCKWHEQHENIAMLLQKTLSPSSVRYLKRAIYLKPEYLNWDDNYAFEVKCIWTLGYINTAEAKEVLEKITKNTNAILSQNAKEQLRKL